MVSSRMVVMCVLSVLLLTSGTQQTIAMATHSAHIRIGQYSIDEVVWDIAGRPDLVDPHRTSDTYGIWICQNVYETLFTWDLFSADTRPNRSMLAFSYVVSGDGLNYTISLRQGVRFHDNTPFNASCVKYNLERVLAIFDTWGPAWMLAEPILGGQAVEDAVRDYGQGSAEHVQAYDGWRALGAILVLDEYTVMLRLANPFAPFIAVLSHTVCSMISPSYIEANGGVIIGQSDSFLHNHTCGTGPYRVTEWSPGEEVVLDLNDRYWGAPPITVSPFTGSFGIDRIRIRTVAWDDERIANLKAGVTQGCDWPVSLADQVYNGVTGDSGDGTLKSSDPDLKVWAGELTYGTHLLAFNLNETLLRDGEIIRNPFCIKEFREAISYAFDYTLYVQDALLGFGAQLQGFIPSGLFGHKDDLFVYDHNIDAAVETWNQAMEQGLDETFANMSYRMVFYQRATSSYTAAAAVYYIIMGGISGILNHTNALQPSSPLDISIRSLDLHAELPQQHAYPFGWLPDFPDTEDYMPLVQSDGLMPARIGLSSSEGWNSSEVDGWILEASRSLSNTRRVELYGLVQDAVVDHCAYLCLSQTTNFHVERARMNGYVFNPMRRPYCDHYSLTSDNDQKPWGFLSDPMFLTITVSALLIAIFVAYTETKRRTAATVSLQ